MPVRNDNVTQLHLHRSPLPSIYSQLQCLILYLCGEFYSNKNISIKAPEYTFQYMLYNKDSKTVGGAVNTMDTQQGSVQIVN